MEYRTLGRTGLSVSVVSLGTGGPSRLGQGSGVPEEEAHQVVRRALELGINLIDTAAGYGESEAILGRALRGVAHDSLIVATKFSVYDRERVRSDPGELARSLDRSLQRLGREAVDLLQLHGVLPADYPLVMDRFYPELERAKAAGKVRFLGITERFFADPGHAMLETALVEDRFDTVMLKYGILNQVAARRVLPMAQERNVGVLNMAAVRVKLSDPAQLAALIADWKAAGKLAADALPEANPLGFLVHGDVDSVVSAGYRFAAAPSAISTVLTGTANRAHLEKNVAALLGPPLPDADTERLQALFGGLVEAV
jgi:aryl-alcohol dehydrogenase-like predicted oxidoreductase